MSTRQFPSILPVPQELSDNPHSGLSMDTCETLLQADRASKAALAAGIPVDTSNIILLLDGSIDSLNDALRIIRARRTRLRALANEKANADAPISRLPAEIIYFIFRYDADEHRVDCDERLSITMSWFRLASVCRLWRHAVFNMPDLRANDLFSFGEMWMDILPLTKGLPLSMSLVGTSSLKFVGRQDVAQLAPRAWKIRAEVRGNKDVRTLVDMLCSEPLPRLQMVALLGSRSRNREKPASTNMARHPHLRYLTLNNIYLDPPPQGALYALQLDMSDSYEEQKPSMDTIFHALQGNTNLRTLGLHDCFDGVRLKQGTSPQRCTFPHLVSLFCSHGIGILVLFTYIHLPALQFAEVRIFHLSTINSVLVALRCVMRLWCSESPSGPDEDTPSTSFQRSVAVVLPKDLHCHLAELGTRLAVMSKATGVQLTAKVAITLGSMGQATKFIVEREGESA